MPLVEEKELLEAIHVHPRRLRYFRDAGIIPYIKTGRLSVLYDLDKVVASLQKLEQKPSKKRKRNNTKAALEAMRVSNGAEIKL